jgi:hypothetical protein
MHKPENDAIVLHGAPVDLASAEGHELIVDCVRAGENLLNDADLCEKHGLSPGELENLAKSKSVIRAVKAESQRRIARGITARERAAKHYAGTPELLNSIATNPMTNHRHVIEACRELRTVATAGGDAENAANAVNFVIKIDLSAGGGEVETFTLPASPKRPETHPAGPALPAPEAHEGNLDDNP